MSLFFFFWGGGDGNNKREFGIVFFARGVMYTCVDSWVSSDRYVAISKVKLQSLSGSDSTFHNKCTQKLVLSYQI